MSLVFLDATTEAACDAAASQQDWLTELAAPWAGGSVTVQIYGTGDTLRDTLTLAAWTIDDGVVPRRLMCGAVTARTNYSEGDITSLIFKTGSTEIFSYIGGLIDTGGDIEFVGPIKALCSPNLEACYVEAPAGLPEQSVPSYMTAAVGEWAQISGTTAPTRLKDFAGVAVRDDIGGVVVYDAASGGHSGNETDNSVKAIDLTDNAPAWTTLLAASDTTGTNLGTGGAGTGADIVMASDGHPVPRHNYTDIWWEPTLNRVMIGGEAAGDNGEASTTDHFGFNPSSNDWDSISTWPARPNYRAYAHANDPVTGKRWAFYNTGSPNRSYEYDPSQPTPTWTLVVWTGGTDYTGTRGAYCWDPVREQIFHLSGGGWFSTAAGYQAQKLDPATLVRADISFNSSSAWTDFQANSHLFLGSALAYDDVDDVFYFYNGNTSTLTGQGAKVYKIIPNATATWDMEIVTVTGVTPADESNKSGAYSKFFYVPRLGTLFLIVGGQNIYYLRTRSV